MIQDLLLMTPNGKQKHSILGYYITRDVEGKRVIDDGSGQISVKTETSMNFKSLYKVFGNLEKDKIGNLFLKAIYVTNKDNLNLPLWKKAQKIKEKICKKGI